MSTVPRSFHGVMEGQGQYNKHAKLPAEGAAFALSLLERAANDVRLGSGEEPIVIADYGSSQGKNSLIPMQVAIKALRKRVEPNRAISVFHIDQPSNDFNSLFEVLDGDPSRYAAPDVYSAAIGKSFYQKVLPVETVHLGWSSYAAMWLSCVPITIPDHFIAIRSTSAARAEFDRQATKDWETFLTLRARELRPGGRLLVVMPGINEEGSGGLDPLFDYTNEVLEELVRDGAITAEERARMAIGVHPRRQQDVLMPFGHDGRFRHLTLEHFEMHELPDAAWTEYEGDRNQEALATKRTLFLRSIFMPSFVSALNPERAGNGSSTSFADHLAKRLKCRLTNHLAPMPGYVHILLLAKGSPA
jgi:hypothetical protein